MYASEITRLSASVLWIKENSVTCANWRLDLPLPLPPRRPPRVSTRINNLVMSKANKKCLKKKGILKKSRQSMRNIRKRLINKYCKLAEMPANYACFHPAFQRYISRLVYFFKFMRNRKSHFLTNCWLSFKSILIQKKIFFLF